MENLAASLDVTIREAGVAIEGVSIGVPDDKTTWTVHPSDLQSAAQPIIEAFDIAANEVARQWAEVRRIRNSKLTDCDWTQIADAQVNASKVTEWQTYRQALRDIPEHIDNPFDDVDWPTPPQEDQ
jgi:hypothetical protein